MTEALDHEVAKRWAIRNRDALPAWAYSLESSEDTNLARCYLDAQAKIEAWRPIVEHAQDLANDGNCPFCTMGLGGDTHEDFCPFSALPPEHRP